MILIKSENTNPYFNLAAEEFLLKSSLEDIFMLWVSEPAVIVGKHQNTYAEINYSFIKENKIKVARRLTGGGAVYHDSGNLNFTFIRNGEKGKLVNFEKFISPVVQALNDIGIPAVHGKKNDILLDGKKISGNAEHVYRKRVLHHGTLLFNSNLDFLNDALKVTPGKYKDRAVQSKRSKVVNISDNLKMKLTMDGFKTLLLEKVGQSASSFYKLNPSETSSIIRLQKEKYESWEWIYGYSPNYEFTNSLESNGFKFNLHFEVEKGIIKNISFSEGEFTTSQTEEFFDLLNGKLHKEELIFEVLKKIIPGPKIKNPEELIKEFF